MNDNKTVKPGMFSHLVLPRNPDAPPAKNARPKRRRKGQLNDGKWAPGYGEKR